MEKKKTIDDCFYVSGSDGGCQYNLKDANPQYKNKSVEPTTPEYIKYIIDKYKMRAH